MGARVSAFDPAGMYQAQAVLKNVTYCTDALVTLEAADALVIVTEWERCRALDLDRLRDLMACPVVVDLRNIYDPEEMNQRGFVYACVGRALAAPSFLKDAQLKRPLLTTVG